MPEPKPDDCETTDLSRDFDSFYEWSLPRVYRYALASTGNQAVAEDITSEAFLSVLGGPAVSPTPRLVLLARLRRTVHNKAIDWIRHQSVKRRAFSSMANNAKGASLDFDSLEHAEQRSMIFYTLSELPEDYRMALQWRYFDDQSVEQIAILGGWSKSAANSLLYRARAAFRKRMDRLAEDPSECFSANAKSFHKPTKSENQQSSPRESVRRNSLPSDSWPGGPFPPGATAGGGAS